MTISDRYNLLFTDFSAALLGLKNAIEKDYSEYDEQLKDLIENGRIQKFETAAELCWKTSKLYLETRLGIIANSPKQVFKQLNIAAIINDELLSALLLIVDDRNLLSHLYKESFFNEVQYRLAIHVKILSQLKSCLS